MVTYLGADQARDPRTGYTTPSSPMADNGKDASPFAFGQGRVAQMPPAAPGFAGIGASPGPMPYGRTPGGMMGPPPGAMAGPPPQMRGPMAAPAAMPPGGMAGPPPQMAMDQAKLNAAKARADATGQMLGAKMAAAKADPNATNFGGVAGGKRFGGGTGPASAGGGGSMLGSFGAPPKSENPR